VKNELETTWPSLCGHPDIHLDGLTEPWKSGTGVEIWTRISRIQRRIIAYNIAAFVL